MKTTKRRNGTRLRRAIEHALVARDRVELAVADRVLTALERRTRRRRARTTRGRTGRAKAKQEK